MCGHLRAVLSTSYEPEGCNNVAAWWTVSKRVIDETVGSSWASPSPDPLTGASSPRKARSVTRHANLSHLCLVPFESVLNHGRGSSTCKNEVLEVKFSTNRRHPSDAEVSFAPSCIGGPWTASWLRSTWWSRAGACSARRPRAYPRRRNCLAARGFPPSRYPWSLLWRAGDTSEHVRALIECAARLSRGLGWLEHEAPLAGSARSARYRWGR